MPTKSEQGKKQNTQVPKKEHAKTYEEGGHKLEVLEPALLRKDEVQKR